VNLNLTLQPNVSPRLLCLGAHCDDIEIGCGGTILKLIDTYPDLTVCWAVLSSTPERADEARASAESFLASVQRKQIIINNFTDSFFPPAWAEIKRFMETLKPNNPDLIFTHYRRDAHQDHRVISELTWNTFRDHLILEYEIPKYDGDLGTPNCFVHLDQGLCERKIGSILEHFRSQHGKQWFTDDTFRALLRLRGVESNSCDRYAEGFYCRKLVTLGI
jgi:LmbE family N-acetylglucosaminyl deacetylase